ncbi:MAG TPA: SH3 domain-containing protein [Terriglobales bacterium]|nr:SH3 domain-containing protein [Terriglobales bacterium]
MLVRAALPRCYINFVIRVHVSRRMPAVRRSLFFVVACIIIFSACGHHHGHTRDAAYVSAPQAILRDQVAAVYNKMGVIKNAERVEILDRDRRYVKVRTSAGVEGWVEQRYLVTQQVYDGFQKLKQTSQSDPVQAAAITRNDTNIHLTPDRNGDHLYQLAEGARVSMLKRATTPKLLPGERQQKAKSDADTKPLDLEDWWLVRDAQGRTGWVLGRMLDVDAPLDVAQYAEGQRIVACFPLDEVPDGDKKVPEYLMLLTEPKDGMPYDFNQVRVFSWNVKRHRYETAYRERGLIGELPVTVSHEDFGKEGNLPTFTIHVQDKNGATMEKKYKLNTPIVKRVQSPEEETGKPKSSR